MVLCEYKRKKNIPWNKTNSDLLPLFDSTSAFDISFCLTPVRFYSSRESFRVGVKLKLKGLTVEHNFVIIYATVSCSSDISQKCCVWIS